MYDPFSGSIIVLPSGRLISTILYKLGSADWSILPTREAAISGATIYSVGGTLSYEQNGVFVSVQLSPATITVYPEALLDLQYFLQRDVYGDDPFTPQIEPSIPFTIATQ